MMASVARSNDEEWQCPVCRKSLAAQPLAGRVTKHANERGDLCTGVGKPAVDLSANAVAKGGQRTRGKVIARKKSPKSAPRQAFPIKPSERAVTGVKGRPEMLPSKKATGAFTLPKNRIKDEDHWSLFQDAPARTSKLTAVGAG
jgi:hypothetical protein